ncbi:hypothetical protein EMPS_08807 [Entomortierella parvispora]|uniref:3'-5' exonuclease n=1 Tax=Entomortierella parvispora TaxID=205924 RepID=A0A9P3LZQ3_9FUNG|nr:hypothetical protein EMPS_08807 [Entomortierella parvispora]
MLTITNQLVHHRSRLHQCLGRGHPSSGPSWPFNETIIRTLKTRPVLSTATESGTGVASVKTGTSTKVDTVKAKPRVSATKAAPTPLETAAAAKSSGSRVRSAPKKSLEPPTPTTALSGASRKTVSTTREKKTAKRTAVSAVRRVATLSPARPADPSVVMSPILSSSLQDQGRVVTSTVRINTSSRSGGSSQSRVINAGAMRVSSSSTTRTAPLEKAQPTISSAVTTSRATPVPSENNPEAPLPFLNFRTNSSRDLMYTKNEEEANQWLASNTTRMWAMDAEWKPFGGHKRQGKMAMVQLGDDKTVFLFHIIHMRSFPKELARILQDRRILKVGINIRNDGYKLFKDWGVACSSIVELGAVSNQLQDDLSDQRNVRSMDTLTREHLGHAVEKVTMTRMGNWETRYLTASQIDYAANDAFVTYEIANQLKKLQSLRPDHEFTLPLATVHKNGSTTLIVRGTLQEREDRAATSSDVLKSTENSNPMTPGKLLNDYPYAEANAKTKKTKPAWASSPTPVGAIKAFKYGNWMSKSSTPPSRKTAPERTSPSDKSDGDFLGLELGGRSETVIIKATPYNNRAVASGGLFRITDYNFQKVDTPSMPENGGNAGDCKGDIYFPSQLLPESLEGKDILERNQVVWSGAGGGRDLSEDAIVDEEETSVWYLNQNQALYASLVSSALEDGKDDSKKK